METSYDTEDLRADETEVDEDLYQLNDIGLAFRLDALRDSGEPAGRATGDVLAAGLDDFPTPA